MEIVTTRVPTTRMPWRQLGVLALIAIILATLLALFAGSRTDEAARAVRPGRQRRHRDGPQRGSVHGRPTVRRDDAACRRTGERRVGRLHAGRHPRRVHPLGPGQRGDDHRADRDGSARRWGAAHVPAEGRDPAATGSSWHRMVGTWPSRRTTTTRRQLRIHVASLDGTSFHQFSDVQITDYGGLAYLAPAGRELVYLARSSNGETHDIRALDVTTGATRAILETSIGNDIFGDVSAAPDGKHIAYALRSVTGTVCVHVVGSDGTDDRVVGHAPGSTFEAWPQWDPQGRRLLIERDAGDGLVHPVIVDLGGGPDVMIDAVISENGAAKAWAPDGSSILAQRTDGAAGQLPQELWDARTGKVTPVSWPRSRRPRGSAVPLIRGRSPPRLASGAPRPTPWARTSARPLRPCRLLIRPALRLPLPLQLPPAAGPVVRDDRPEQREHRRSVDRLVLADRDEPAGLVALAAGDDPLGIGREAAVVEEHRDVVLRREQRDDVALSTK